MNWVAAVIIETREEFILRSLYIRADNRYEAIGKAHAVTFKLWPNRIRTHVNVCPADEKHLIDDPEKAEHEN